MAGVRDEKYFLSLHEINFVSAILNGFNIVLALFADK